VDPDEAIAGQAIYTGPVDALDSAELAAGQPLDAHPTINVIETKDEVGNVPSEDFFANLEPQLLYVYRFNPTQVYIPTYSSYYTDSFLETWNQPGKWLTNVVPGEEIRVKLSSEALLQYSATGVPSEQDLSDYPDMFVSNGQFNGFIIAGEVSAAIDVIPGMYVAGNMWNNKVPNELVPIGDGVRLDSEILDDEAQNSIIIGGSCINSVAADVSGNPADCTEGFSPGKGIIKLIKHPNGNYALLVAGFSGADSRLVAQVLAHRSSELSGMEVEITNTDGTWQNADIEVQN